MNILLIDDDEMITTTMKSMIEWEKMNIESVYSASNAVLAKKIMESVMIDIMICDIEMPEISGLELVEWARNQGSDAQVIFLTSYAEFSYARQALQLQGQEYLLKPISFKKLNEAILEAVEACCKKQKLQQQLEFWNQKPEIRTGFFWRWICAENIEILAEDIKKAAATLNYKMTDRFIYIRLEIYDYNTIYEKMESGMFTFVLTNITRELFTNETFGVETVFRTDSEDESQWNLILSIKQQEKLKERLRDLCQTYVIRIDKVMNSKVGCFIGEDSPLETIAKSILHVIQVSQEVVMGKERICFADEVTNSRTAYVEPEFILWEELLLAGEKEAVIKKAFRYLECLERNKEANRRMFGKFQEDFRQMIYSVLKERKIFISQCDWMQAGDGNGDSIKSLDAMKQYIRRNVEEVSEILKTQSAKNSITEQIKQYINQHMEEELTRETFADMFYLNPDYLAKLFKKETGISLGSYLVGQRMERAKQLLAASDLKINEISIQVGYDSFSYFSKIFREYTGMSPNEFRKNKKIK